MEYASEKSPEWQRENPTGFCQKAKKQEDLPQASILRSILVSGGIPKKPVADGQFTNPLKGRRDGGKEEMGKRRQERRGQDRTQEERGERNGPIRK